MDTFYGISLDLVIKFCVKIYALEVLTFSGNKQLNLLYPSGCHSRFVYWSVSNGLHGFRGIVVFF